jgi:hypothetical protein
MEPSYATIVGLVLLAKNKLTKSEVDFKNFTKVWQSFSEGFSFSKFKNFFKQFIP